MTRTLAALERLGCSVVARYSGEQGLQLEDLARNPGPEFEAIVAAGGDGTVDAVLNGLAAADDGMKPPLGILPVGTVNLLARELGLPRDPERLAAVLAFGPVRQIWPGRAGDRLFTVVSSCGFDADTVAAIDPALKSRFGRLAFAPAVLKTLRHRPRRSLSLRIDGQDHVAAAVIVAKGRYYAGPFTIAREATVAEPRLDAVLLRSDSRAALLRCVAAGLGGTVHRLRDIEIRRCTAVSIGADGPAPVQADGEIVGMTPITIGLAERPIDLIWP